MKALVEGIRQVSQAVMDGRRLRRLFCGLILLIGWVLTFTFCLTLSSNLSRSFAKQAQEVVVAALPLFVDSNLTLEDICLTVKTSKQFHNTRLDIILKTWHKTANDKVYFITDQEDMKYRFDLGNRLVSSICRSGHGRTDLCCKLGLEFDTFMGLPDKRWWCRFDDDNYVNVDRLLEYLRKFDSGKPVYIGRRSVHALKAWYGGKPRTYYFGTGGAGVCISRPLAERMRPWCGVNVFPRTCFYAQAADDCSLGFVITYLLGVNFTESFLFHSHMEKLKGLNASRLDEQISFSYRVGDNNVINVPNPKYNESDDPTRMLSLHCHIHPQDELCTS